MLQSMMQKLLGSAQSDPEMFSRVAQLLVGQADTSGGAAGEATARPEKVSRTVRIKNTVYSFI